MPATVSAVLFRDKASSYSAFSQDASYLFHEDDDIEAMGFNTSSRTLECTKRMMGLKFLAAFKLYGRQGIASLIEHVFSLAGQFAGLVAKTQHFSLLMLPQTNIVCFRYLGNAALYTATLNTLQMDIRKKLLQQGLFHLSQVDIDGHIWLRCTFMNPYTQPLHQQALWKILSLSGKACLYS